jgi:hypothetical protein
MDHSRIKLSFDRWTALKPLRIQPRNSREKPMHKRLSICRKCVHIASIFRKEMDAALAIRNSHASSLSVG